MTRIPSSDDLRSRFQRWRRTRQGKAPIPDELWAAAVAVARRDAVNPTTAALHLDGGKLKTTDDSVGSGVPVARSPSESVPAGGRAHKNQWTTCLTLQAQSRTLTP